MNKHQPVYGSHSHFSTQTAKFDQSVDDDLSSPVDIRSANTGCAVFPAEFDSDSISFLVSLDGINYYALASTTLSPASGPVALALPAALFNWGWFKYVTDTGVLADADVVTGLKSGV